MTDIWFDILFFIFLFMFCLRLVINSFKRHRLGSLIFCMKRSCLNIEALGGIILFVFFILNLSQYLKYNLRDIGAVRTQLELSFIYLGLGLPQIMNGIKKPQIREGGLCKFYGCWKWEDIDSYYFNSDMFIINIKSHKKFFKFEEIIRWMVRPEEKEIIEGALDKFINKINK